MRIFLLFLIMTMTYGRVPSDPSYVVKYISGSQITKAELDNYTRATKLNDIVKVALFKNSSSFSEYQQKEVNFLKSKEQESLKEYSYFRALEVEALRKNPRRRRPRNLDFTLKDQEAFRQFQEYESEVLKELLDQRIGIRKAMEEFGTQLREKNYPHRLNETGTDVYLRWRENEINRIEIEMLIREAKQFERAMVFQEYKHEIKVSLFEPQNRHAKLLARAQEIFADGTYTREELLQLTQQNSEVRAVIEEFRIFDLKDTPLNRFSDNILVEQIEQWWTGFSDYQSSVNSEKLIAFHANIQSIAQKYETEERLRELSDEAKENFVRDTNYKQLLMSKLYNLARLHLKLGTELDLSIIEEEYEALKGLVNPEYVESSKESEKSLEAHVRFTLTTRARSLDTYHKELIGLGHWLYLFELRKSLANLRPFLRVSYHSISNFDSYKALESQIKKERFDKAMADYREKMQWRYGLSD